MGISLFNHNQAAYESAVKMLSTSGKAAIIHPTGTGKSFIGFKLCEDNSEAQVCWLSPSEYIFETQLENLRKAADGYMPGNIEFMTYAKLMKLGDAELNKIQPDYIILDEFHRCGAEMWGQGVERLLKTYPNSKILGLSATAVRYLDNCRDMSDELFDGNIASQVTLGEAIVRGILKAPKYVLSVYSYKTEYEKYRLRVESAKSGAVHDAGEKYLEALRRAIEKSEGLDEIFAKHMTSKDGKYIVFCANYQHMQEMRDKVSDWFKLVDKNPNLYFAYSESSETDAEFSRFKADDSNHLKLLFCIDMLNEGIHIDDVDGVILLRPTVSPIVYKQQIGRALSASNRKNPIIFDIVMNIENLYGIGAIEDEMQVATAYYRSMGLDEEIVNEHFRITDEVRDCAELFERLNETLGASWNLMYESAKNYYLQNGDLEVPKRYVTENGYSLGAWINTQRLVFNGKTDGNINDEQIDLLNEIGMRWESVRDISWERNFSAANKYYEENKNLLVNSNENRYCGVALGRWISQLRAYRKNGVQNAYLTDKRIKMLDDIGMVWDVRDLLWETNFASAEKFFKTNGHLDVPTFYVDESGIKLGAWLANIRNGKRSESSRRAELTDEQKKRLEVIGFSWKSKYDDAWDKSYAEAQKYYVENGHINVPVAYVTDTGCRLGRWIRRQRDGFESLSAIKQKKLAELGLKSKIPSTNRNIKITRNKRIGNVEIGV